MVFGSPVEKAPIHPTITVFGQGVAPSTETSFPLFPRSTAGLGYVGELASYLTVVCLGMGT